MTREGPGAAVLLHAGGDAAARWFTRAAPVDARDKPVLNYGVVHYFSVAPALACCTVSRAKESGDNPCKPINLALSGILPDVEDAIMCFAYLYRECCCINKEQRSLSSFAWHYFLRNPNMVSKR